MKALALCVLTAALSSIATAGDTLLVPAHFATIQRAIDAAEEGDSIKVSRGVYPEALQIHSKIGITIHGAGKPILELPPTPGLGPPAAIVQIVDCSQINFRGFQLQDSPTAAIHVHSSEDVLVEKCSVAGGFRGIMVFGGRRVTLARNQLEGTTGTAIALGWPNPYEPAADSSIIGNSFRRTRSTAIEVRGDRNLVAKNKLVDQVSGGISILFGSDNRLEKNRIRARGDAVFVNAATGRGVVVSKNRIESTDHVGLVLSSDGILAEQNKIRSCGTHGIRVSANGCSLTKNTVTACGFSGIWVDGRGNFLTRNKAKKNADFDLFDTQGAGVNFYERNKFGTRN